MLDFFLNLDTQILLAVNSVHSPYFDKWMWIVSKTLTWWILYATLLYFFFKMGWKRALVMIVGVALLIFLCDQISASVLKPLVHRLRPSHTPGLEDVVHLVNNKRGGLYGFVSSHATNTFGAAFFVAFVFWREKIWRVIFIWPVIVCYSRMYLARHYLGDILGGMILGGACAALVFVLCRYAIKRLNLGNEAIMTYSKNKILLVAMILNILYVSVLSYFYVL